MDPVTLGAIKLAVMVAAVPVGISLAGIIAGIREDVKKAKHELVGRAIDPSRNDQRNRLTPASNAHP